MEETKMAEGITFKTIGVVRNELKEARRGPEVQQIVSEIEMDKSLTDALDHLDDFSYIMVVYLTPPARRRGTQGFKNFTP